MKPHIATLPDPPSANHDPGDDERYVVNDPREIAFMLKKVRNNGQLITAYLDDGDDFALTALLELMPDTGEMVIERSPDASANRRLLAAKKVVLVTSHDQVKLKFTAVNLAAIEYQGRPALRAALPRSLMRIQRRDYYRICTPITKPLICTLPMPQRGPGSQTETIVLDISIGGVALMDNQGTTGFQIGEIHENCRIGLPQVGTLSVSLIVRNSFDTPLRNGRSFRRCGCQFLHISPSTESLVQRYILQLERSRKFRR